MSRWRHNREMAPVIALARDLGCTVEMTGRNHVRITHPKGDAPVYVAGTPGSAEAVRNAMCRVRKIARRQA